VNRVFFPYTMAACLLADCGANPYQVRRARAGGKGGPGGCRCRFVVCFGV
jgi:hypothetical protein